MVASLNADLRFHHLLSKSHHNQHREHPGKRDMVMEAGKPLGPFRKIPGGHMTRREF